MTIVVLAVLAIVVALATVPVSHTIPFSFSESGSGSGTAFFASNWTQWLCPVGAHVGVTFSSDGLDVSFAIFAPNGTAFWSGISPGTTVSFVTSVCGYYVFHAVGSGNGSYTIAGTESFTAPILSAAALQSGPGS